MRNLILRILLFAICSRTVLSSKVGRQSEDQFEATLKDCLSLKSQLKSFFKVASKSYSRIQHNLKKASRYYRAILKAEIKAQIQSIGFTIQAIEEAMHVISTHRNLEKDSLETKLQKLLDQFKKILKKFTDLDQVSSSNEYMRLTAQDPAVNKSAENVKNETGKLMSKVVIMDRNSLNDALERGLVQGEQNVLNITGLRVLSRDQQKIQVLGERPT